MAIPIINGTNVQEAISQIGRKEQPTIETFGEADITWQQRHYKTQHQVTGTEVQQPD